MALVKSWLAYVLLHHVLNLIFFDLAVIKLVSLFLCSREAVLLGRLDGLLYLEELVHVFLVKLLLSIQLLPQFFNLVHNKDALALGPRFWLAYVEHGGVFLRLGLRHATVFN